jgi:hypothetical protein
VPTNQLKRIFLQAAKDFTSSNVLAWLRSYLSLGASGRRWPRDEEFKRGWLNYNIYSVPRRCKLILDALEKSYAHKELADLDAASIEHVMPQTLTDEWRDMIGVGNSNDEVHDRWVDTIGNLTLTAYNPELSNFEFTEKKKLYAASHYCLNEYFSGCATWRIEEITERADRLWEQAVRLWPSPNQTLDLEVGEELWEESDDEQTSNELLNAKREAILLAFSKREGVNLKKIRGVIYASEGREVVVAFPVSRRYNRASSSYYWYGYSIEWPEILATGKKSFLVLGCMDKDCAYAIPSDVMEPLVRELYLTEDRHWHVMMEENEIGQMELTVPEKLALQVDKYEIKLS